MLDLSKKDLLPRLGRIEQLASIRPSILCDGSGKGLEVIDVRNGSGLAFTILKDKGLDIGQCDFEGLPISWLSPNGLVAPSFYDPNSFEWLRSWSGGLLTSCGPLNVGTPCTTSEGEQGLHGRLHNIPASSVNATAKWLPDGRYLLEVSGIISDTKVFGEKLINSRTIRTYLGSPAIEIIDSIENYGYETMPLMRLNHMNFGYPLIDDGTYITAPEHEVIPRNDYDAASLANWNKLTAPIHGFQEQVFYHDLPADENGIATIAIHNPKRNISLTLSFRKKELPYLVQWKMTGEGEYVLGLEPANCYPEGKNDIEEKGLLHHIEPGQIIESYIKVEISKQ